MRSPMQFLLAVVALGGAVVAAQSPQYAKIGDIHVGGGSGFDYLTADTPGKRLYVSHGTEVVVIDTSNDSVVGRIADTPGVHGIAVAPNGKLYVTNGRGTNPDGKMGNVSIVDAKTLQTLDRVQTAVGPDAIMYEPKHKEIYSINHAGKSVSVIDAGTGKVTATIPLTGTAETAQADGDRVYVNIEDKSQIDVIDVDKKEVIAHWPVAPAEGPTGMAVDTATHRLFVGGDKALVMIDDKTGKVVANAPICDGTDAAVYDPSSKLVFASCSDGKVTIAHVDGPAKLTVVQTLATTRGARTIALDTATHKIYLAANNYQAPDPNAPAPAPGQRGRGPAAVPDSFHVLIYAPK